MKFYVSVAFLETREIVEIAKAADDLGYEGLGIPPDHVVNLETLATPYPYTKNGERRWQPFTDWPDPPWVLVGSLAQATEQIKFVTTVYIPGMRDPYSAAKSIGTAAYLADGRVELGIGVGWCEEEFTLMGQQFAKRGQAHRRDDPTHAGAVAARVDGVRRRVLQDSAAGDDAHAAAHPPHLQRGDCRISRCAEPPDSTAGSVT